jgi:ketosteroid isomerase-like protein
VPDVPSPAAVADAFWRALDGRDWAAVGALLADDVVYEVPQTRERVRGREAVVRFNAEYPGDWSLEVTALVADGHRAATTIRFASAGEPDQTGIAFFEVDAGRITRMTDWWPEAYEPPPGREHLVERW